MVNPKELRIGNLVQLYRRPVDINKSNHIVTEIFIGLDSCYYIIIEDGFKVNINKGIEPIPLTSEWLVKFGFNNNQYGINLDAGMFYLDWKGSYLVLADADRTVRMKMEDIKYVHQLQNLYFALTQKELKIEDFASHVERDLTNPQ